MSHARSFQFMDRDELEIVRAYDQYKLDVIAQGPIAQLRQHGVGGLDEALYAAAHRLPPLRSHKAAYLQDQIRRAEREIERQDGTMGRRLRHILDIEPNPATFFTLGQERKALRAARLKRMAEGDETLYFSEKARAAGAAMSDRLQSTADFFGGVAGAMMRYWMVTVAAGALTLSLPIWIRWQESEAAYKPVAQAYVQSSEYGSTALPLKRDIPAALEEASTHLTYREEIVIDLGDDGEFTIPERLAQPRRGRKEIVRMDAILRRSLAPERVERFTELSDLERRSLHSYRNQAHGALDGAQHRLADARNPYKTYDDEKELAQVGNGHAQDAVRLLERHMDGDVVQAENAAHQTRSLWKWSTFSLWGLAGLFGANALRNASGQRRRHRYYGS